MASFKARQHPFHWLWSLKVPLPIPNLSITHSDGVSQLCRFAVYTWRYIPSVALILFRGSPNSCCFSKLEAGVDVCVYANKHTSTLTHAKNDIFVSAYKEKEGLIMHKHNNFLQLCLEMWKRSGPVLTSLLRILPYGFNRGLFPAAREGCRFSIQPK